ncbi:MAG: MFS transporter, partial [Spirochaetota bacterium]
VSVILSKHIGKKRVYQLCFGIMAIACMGIFFLGHRSAPGVTLGFMAFAGIGLGFGYVPPFAMLPDAIEAEAVTTGLRREGAYYGIWTFVAKLGQSLATALLGLILAATNYVPEVSQSPESILAMRLLIGPIPAVVLVAGMVLIQFYPIDEKTYSAIMAGKEPA